MSNQIEKTELSQTKLEQLQRQPIIETQINKTKDEKWVIHRTTITDIKPISYFEKVLKKSP